MGLGGPLVHLWTCREDSGVGGGMTNPTFPLSFVCATTWFTVTTSAHFAANLGALSLSFYLMHFYIFPKATWAAFLWVARLPQITKIAWVLESEPSYSPIYYLVLLFLNLLIIHTGKEIPFGPFKTSKLADLNTQPLVTSGYFGSLLKWSF